MSRNPILDQIPVLEYVKNSIDTYEYKINYCLDENDKIIYIKNENHKGCFGWHYKNTLNDECRKVIEPYVSTLLEVVGY